MADFTLNSLRGGFDDFSPVTLLAQDACRLAENVEFVKSLLGERRAGCALPNAGLPAGLSADALLSAAVWMFCHQPTKNEADDELWVMSVDSDNTPHLYQLKASGWTTITFSSANGTPIMTSGDAYQIYGQSLHGKLFLAFHSAEDRLHCYDGTGTALRVVGLAAHAAAPTVANGGGVGTYAAVARYYRTRSVARNGVVVLRRSEPSASVTFTPDAAHLNATVTRPTAIGEGETDWEVEGSLDNAAFYRLATVAIATTTYADSAVVTTYANNVLSDPIGSYTTIPSVKRLLADDDRLLTGGSWTVAADGSAVRWTPVGTDPLPGPDERLNSTTDPRVDLDGLEGGDITSMSQGLSAIIVFKTKHFYNLIRTGLLVGAYDAVPLTKVRGALSRSVIEATDQSGRPAVYFIDQSVGPMRYSQQGGLEFAGFNIKTLFGRLNKSAVVPCHGVYYPDKLQIHYWLALDSDLYPTTKVVLQTNEVASDDKGARRGWSVVPSPTRIADARCSCVFHVDIQGGDLRFKPFIGKAVWTVNAATVKNVIQMCDTGTTDAFTAGDTGATYVGKVRSRPFLMTGLMNQFGISNSSLLGLAGSRVLVSLIRDYGTETIVKSANLTAVGTETHVRAGIDDLTTSELFALEVQFEDDPANPSQWELHQFAAVEGAGATG